MENKPIITKCVSAGTRLYYFDAYEDSKGKPFLSISEIPKGNSPVKTKRQRIFVHIEDLDKFGEAVADIIYQIKNDIQPTQAGKCQ